MKTLWAGLCAGLTFALSAHAQIVISEHQLFRDAQRERRHIALQLEHRLGRTACWPWPEQRGRHQRHAPNGGTFGFIAQVADNASATAQQIFTVAIQNNAPSLGVETITSGIIQLLITGDGGANCSLESSGDLLDWEARLTTNAPAMPFQWTDPRPANGAARFYRVWLGQ